MGATEWVTDVVVVEVWCHFVPAIGSAGLRGADTTILLKMLAVCAVVLVVPERRLLQTPLSRLRLSLQQVMVWVLLPWQGRLARVLSLLLPVALALEVSAANNTVARQANTRYPLDLELQLVLMHRWVVDMVKATLGDHLIAERPRRRSHLLVMARLNLLARRMGHPIMVGLLPMEEPWMQTMIRLLSSRLDLVDYP